MGFVKYVAFRELSADRRKVPSRWLEWKKILRVRKKTTTTLCLSAFGCSPSSSFLEELDLLL